MNRFYILLFALFTLALVGCEKEEFAFDEPTIENEDNGEEPEPAPISIKTRNHTLRSK